MNQERPDSTARPFAETVNVNSSRTPLGALYFRNAAEGLSEALPERVRVAAAMIAPIDLKKVNQNTRLASGFINFFFPTRQVGIGSSLLLMTMRMLLSLFFIFSALRLMATDGSTHVVATLVMIGGLMMCAGLLTRPVAALMTALFVGLTFAGGGFSEIYALYSLMTAMVCVAGPGIFSLDWVARRNLMKRAVEHRRRLARRRLSYNAYNADYTEASLS